MKFTSHAITAAVAAVLCSTIGFAQTPSPPQSTTTPSSASSPSQRDATRSPASEAPQTPGAEPSDASTPHQREAMAKPQTMKECMDTQAAKNSGVSKDEMKKTCDAQMKMQKSHMSKAPTTPKPGEGESKY